MAASGTILYVLTRRASWGVKPKPLRVTSFTRRSSSNESTSSRGTTFDKILIANRGEIACRVIRTANRMGIKTVSVYSEADRGSMHVSMSNESYCIGGGPSSESYLKMNRIIDVAKMTGSDAIHPGYGFLSENKHFANLCQNEGIEFIGPPASAIEQMGVKRVSKEIMNNSSVPIVPGYYGNDQSDDNLQDEADKIGYPVLIKADLGGGGKGMRIVWDRAEFKMMLEACRSEAMKSFNDDKVLLEKYLERPRHVEVQVFGDKHGNMVHLYERDCSVQRRHQKIIEEAPAPLLLQSTRDSIWSAAVRAAKAVGYVGAGTVEFILDEKEKFYFMEMNTRLQVEHPITEMITGTDLVEWQIKVAAGQPLPLDQSQISCNGHAFEARIYAENPAESFRPSPGLLRHLATPIPSSTVRIDTGVRGGDEVTPLYDPMIAKLVVWSHDRHSALNDLVQSLNQYQVVGVHTNVDFLTSLSLHPSFKSADVHTGFIEQHQDELFPSNQELTLRQKRLAILSHLLIENNKQQQQQQQPKSKDPYSLFNTNSGLRVNSNFQRKVSLLGHDKLFTSEVEYSNGQYIINIDDETMTASGQLHMSPSNDTSCRLIGFIGTERISLDVVKAGNQIHCFTNDGDSFVVQLPLPDHMSKESLTEGDVGIHSPPYTTRVNKVVVDVGDKVKKGQVLMAVEGMKMETNIPAPFDGVVVEILYHEGDTVPPNSVVIILDNDSDVSNDK